MFPDAHRRSIGVTLSQLSELLATVRRAGVAEPRIGAVEAAIEETARATGAERPDPRRGLVNASLVQMLVLEEELRSRRMSAYGQLDEDAARLLDEHVERLVELTNALIEEADRPPAR